MAASFTISCDDCVMEGTDACHDCVVTFVCGVGNDNGMAVDADEHRALGLLVGAGLVPRLRYEPAAPDEAPLLG